MGNNSVPKFIFPVSRFPVYRGSVLGRFYCIIMIFWEISGVHCENRVDTLIHCGNVTILNVTAGDT